MLLENFEEAITDLNMVIKIGLFDQESLSIFDTYLMRGNAKLFIKKYEESIKDFDKAIEFKPENGKAYFERGKAWLLIGNSQKAGEDKFKALKLGYNEED